MQSESMLFFPIEGLEQVRSVGTQVLVSASAYIAWRAHSAWCLSFLFNTRRSKAPLSTAAAARGRCGAA